jgi:hypothetical protein
VKTVCLFGPDLPPFFKETDPRSELVEKYAIDLWHAGFGVLTPHLNAPREEGLVIPDEMKLAFDVCAIKNFANAIMVMPGWEADESVWLRVYAAQKFGKPVFDSLAQLVRWRENRASAEVRTADCWVQHSNIPEATLKIAFVAGKYYVGVKESGILIPNRNAIHENIISANAVAVRLWREGIGAFTPHNNTHHFELKTKIDEAVYQEFDRLLLERFVQAVTVLESWVNSQGALKEVALTQELGRPVMYAHDLQSLRNWRDNKGIVHVVGKLELKEE